MHEEYNFGGATTKSDDDDAWSIRTVVHELERAEEGDKGHMVRQVEHQSDLLPLSSSFGVHSYLCFVSS